MSLPSLSQYKQVEYRLLSLSEGWVSTTELLDSIMHSGRVLANNSLPAFPLEFTILCLQKSLKVPTFSLYSDSAFWDFF
jgi:hypothetical protein